VRNPHPPRHVGDTVRLNDHGLEVCFGNRRMQHMKTLHMRITHIDTESITSPEKTYIVEVDNPEINDLMLYDACFDVVTEAKP
jgi:hypothetical protein